MRFWRRHGDTVRTLAIALAIAAGLFVLGTPLCIWLSGSVDSCERMTCELLAMTRPLADLSYCEAWFDLFRPEAPQ